MKEKVPGINSYKVPWWTWHDGPFHSGAQLSPGHDPLSGLHFSLLAQWQAELQFFPNLPSGQSRWRNVKIKLLCGHKLLVSKIDNCDILLR